MMSRQHEVRRQRTGRALLGVWIVALLVTAVFGVRATLESLQTHGHLVPSDTPAVVASIVALATSVGTVIGVTLTAYARYTQARGRAQADVMHAQADLKRAEADFLRAQSGLPQIEPATTDTAAGPTPSPDTPTPG